MKTKSRYALLFILGIVFIFTILMCGTNEKEPNPPMTLHQCSNIVGMRGVVIGDDVRMRSAANTTSSIRGKLNHGDNITFIERSTNLQTIGDTTDYWYMIEDAQGRAGWMFGYFLACAPQQKEPINAISNSDAPYQNDHPDWVTRLWNGEWHQTNIIAALDRSSCDIISLYRNGYTNITFYTVPNTLIIRIGMKTKVLEWDTLRMINTDKVVFEPAGVSVRRILTLSNNYVIEVRVPRRIYPHSLMLTKIDGAMRSIVQDALQQLSAERLNPLIGGYSSSKYGILKIDHNFSFEWKATNGIRRRGRLELDLRPATEKSGLWFRYRGPTTDNPYLYECHDNQIIFMPAITNKQGKYMPQHEAETLIFHTL